MYEVECPYCEEINKVNCIESNYWERECCNCGEQFKVDVEYEPILFGTKFNMKTCLECDKKFDKDWTNRTRFSEKYETTADVCENCIRILEWGE